MKLSQNKISPAIKPAKLLHNAVVLHPNKASNLREAQLYSFIWNNYVILVKRLTGSTLSPRKLATNQVVVTKRWQAMAALVGVNRKNRCITGIDKAVHG